MLNRRVYAQCASTLCSSHIIGTIPTLNERLPAHLQLIVELFMRDGTVSVRVQLVE
jgi:hypothetical protein|eukprot:COSAG01_NODE_2001_length_8673_cov_22.568346_4_plen_56_part_00